MRFIVVALLLLTFGFTVAAQDPPPAQADNVNSWQEFTSKEGEFSVLLPGTPIQQDRNLQTGIGPVPVRDFFLQSDISAYYLSYARFPNVGPLTPQDYKEMLDASRDRVLADGSKVIRDRKSTRLNSSHSQISYAVFCLK